MERMMKRWVLESRHEEASARGGQTTPLNGCASLRRIHSLPLMAALRTDHSDQLRRRASRQSRAAHKDPRHPQLWRRSGHQRHRRCFLRCQFMQMCPHMNDLRQFDHLHLRHDDGQRQLAVSDGVARTIVLRCRSVVILFWRGAAGTVSSRQLRQQTAHRRWHHKCQHRDCEDLPEVSHQ